MVILILTHIQLQINKRDLGLIFVLEIYQKSQSRVAFSMLYGADKFYGSLNYDIFSANHNRDSNIPSVEAAICENILIKHYVS